MAGNPISFFTYLFTYVPLKSPECFLHDSDNGLVAGFGADRQQVVAMTCSGHAALVTPHVNWFLGQLFAF